MFYNSLYLSWNQDQTATIKPHPLLDSLSVYVMGLLRSVIHNGISNMKKNLFLILCGQILSAILAISAGTQAILHAECHIAAPNFANALVYMLLAVQFVPLIVWGRKEKNTKKDDEARRVLFAEEGSSSSPETRSDHDSMSKSPPAYSLLFGFVPLHAPPWAYLLMALADVEGNFLAVSAFKYSTVSYNMFIDYLAVPVAMMLSWSFLNRQYTSAHMVGATICILGAHINVIQLYQNSKDGEVISNNTHFSNFGELLAIIAAVLFGANLFVTEIFDRDIGGPVETLAMRGLFGAPLALLQSVLLEADSVRALFAASPTTMTGISEKHTCAHGSIMTLFLSFVAMSLLRYVGTTQFLSHSETGLLIISFLSADMWISTFSFVTDRDYLLWSITTMILGINIYQSGISPIQEESKYYSDCENVEIGERVPQSIIEPPPVLAPKNLYMDQSPIIRSWTL